MPGSLADNVSSRLSTLAEPSSALCGLLRGIEKESLRITPDGTLSQRPHPQALGSALAHSSITTDFSEAQLELITGVHPSPEACLDELADIHSFVFENLEGELLWPSSMPCLMSSDDAIPIGQYGTSNIGQAKTVYRRGLGVRYGRLMQTISGIHYNFSVPDSLWQQLGITSQAQRTEAYFGLIRNFRRWSWLLIYAFGASPAVCKSFTRQLNHNLKPFDEGSLHLPYATSLRMGPLGYQSSAQSNLHVSYNSLDNYATSMLQALTDQYQPYIDQGVMQDGKRVQLNTAILQIENEFYGTIRPKRTIQPGERPVTALKARGVEYVEVRCVDLNPFLPLGIDATQIRFLDTFLLLCLLADSPQDTESESKALLANQQLVVEQGREPDLVLTREDGAIGLAEWATELLQACEPIAELLDNCHGGDAYARAHAEQAAKVADAETTPSAQVLATMAKDEVPFFRFTMQCAQITADYFRQREFSASSAERLTAESTASLQRQAAIEAADEVDFETFLESYLALP